MNAGGVIGGQVGRLEYLFKPVQLGCRKSPYVSKYHLEPLEIVSAEGKLKNKRDW